MGVVNEDEVKRQTQFLRYESGSNGNQLMLKSKLYKIDSHFLNSVKASVLCRGDECQYCSAGYQKRTEFNYFVWLNGETGYIDIKPSVFFAIQTIAKAQKRDVREISWTIIKQGEGLKTEYTVSKDDNLAPEDFKRVQEELESNTERLEELMERREEQLDQNYITHLKDVRKQEQPKATGESSIKHAIKGKDSQVQEAEVIEDEPDEVKEEEEVEVKPDEIPF